MAPSFYAVDPKLVDGTPLTLHTPADDNPTSTHQQQQQSSVVVIWRLVLPSTAQDKETLKVPLESHEVLTSLDALYPQLSTKCSAGPSLERLQTCLADTDTFSLFLATEITTFTADPITTDRTPSSPPASTLEISKILGALTLVTLKLLMKSCAHIEDVVVDGTCRSRGLGKALMRRGLDEAVHTHGCIMVDLTSNPSRIEARTLYQSLGFELRDTGVFRYTAPNYRK